MPPYLVVMLQPKAIILLTISWLILTPTYSQDRISPEEIDFRQIEVPVYRLADYTDQVALEIPYAGFEIDKPEDWLAVAATHEVYEIDLVFTKYPADISRWRTDYHGLLKDRIDELVTIDSSFLNRGIQWNMFLQTQCKTEAEAKRYFHGFVIKYRPKEVRIISDVSTSQDLFDLISGHAVPSDSTVIKVMERHPDWKKMLVVMDWTGSMYQYGAQLVLWHKLGMHAFPDRMSHLVFFNDGNKKKSWQKAIGKTGGIYYTHTHNISGIVGTMEKVMTRGDGGDIPENDLEAVLKSTKLLEDFEEIILIADNKSDVRDIQLLKELTVPVHVILCDVQADNYLNRDYVKIAFQSGGSLHTMEEDIEGLAELQQGEQISIGNMDYHIKDGTLCQWVEEK